MSKEKTLYSKLEGMLYNYKKIQQEVKNLYLEIEYVRNNYKGIDAISYEEKTNSTNKFNSSVENEIINKEKKIEKLKNILEGKELIIKKINNALNVLKPKEKEIIEARYMEGLSWPAIAEQTYLSESRCYQVKNKIIKELIPIVFIGL